MKKASETYQQNILCECPLVTAARPVTVARRAATVTASLYQQSLTFYASAMTRISLGCGPARGQARKL